MARAHFMLTSPAFEGMGPIGRAYTCDGSNQSPPLAWSHAPEETRSFALIMEDPDAPGGIFTHWVLWNIPGTADTLDSGTADEVGVHGRNDFQGTGYGGPCPPPHHGPHRYRFRLFALDVPSLPLQPAATRAQLEMAMEGHVLAETVLVGRYGRAPRSSR